MVDWKFRIQVLENSGVPAEGVDPPILQQKKSIRNTSAPGVSIPDIEVFLFWSRSYVFVTVFVFFKLIKNKNKSNFIKNKTKIYFTLNFDLIFFPSHFSGNFPIYFILTCQPCDERKK